MIEARLFDFKCRAECVGDVRKFLEVVDVGSWQTTQPHRDLPDVEFTFVSPHLRNGGALLSLEGVRAVMKALEDCHVMAETLALAPQYTGERSSLQPSVN